MTADATVQLSASVNIAVMGSNNPPDAFDQFHNLLFDSTMLMGTTSESATAPHASNSNNTVQQTRPINNVRNQMQVPNTADVSQVHTNAMPHRYQMATSSPHHYTHNHNTLLNNFSDIGQSNMSQQLPTFPPAQTTLAPTDLSAILGTMTQVLQQNATLLQQSQRTNTNFHVMPDLSKAVGDFDGEGTPQDAKFWLKQLETTAQMNQWPESFTLQMACSHMVGAARHWLSSHRIELHSWIAFAGAFRRTFVDTLDMPAAWEAMRQRKQQQGESIPSYFHHKVKLCRQLNLNLREIADQVAAGLASRVMALHVCARNYADEDELLRELTTLDRVARDHDSLFPSNRGRPRLPQHKPGKTESNHNTEGSTSDVKNYGATSQTITCYNCQKGGHIARECTEQKLCSKCKQPGHMARFCTAPTAREDIKLVLPEGAKSSKEVYERNVRINNHDSRAMIDTGCSTCTIKASLVIDFELQVTKQPCDLYGFGATTAAVKSVGIVQADVTVDNVTAHQVALRIVPDDSQPWDIILGQSFLRDPGVAFYAINDNIRFEPTDELAQLLPNLPVNETFKHSAVSESTTVPAHSVLFIRTQLEDTNLELPLLNFGKEAYVSVDTSIERVLSVSTPPEMQPRREPINEDEVNVGDNVTPEQKQQLTQILNEYRSTIAKNLDELGKTNLIEMDIQVKPNSNPVYSKPYKATQAERAEIKRIVSEWKAAGVVRETSSPYASPVLLVKKKDGSSRLVVDYRKLNAQSQRMPFPLPDLDECLEALHGAKCFASLDLYNGYLQVPLTENAKEKTAFITPDETGEFERSMFGLMNSPFYFSKMMDRALRPLRNNVVVFYLDDTLIPAKRWDDLMSKLRIVLQALEKAGLTLNLKKCNFGGEKINFLGFVITTEGIRPGESKTKAIEAFPAPRNVHEIRQFIGLANFFRRFIPYFAHIAAPMTNLTKNKVVFVWKDKQQESFDEIKLKLTSNPVLALYNANASRTELHTDASKIGLGAIMVQADDDGNMRLVYAISRKTSEAEQNYHSSKAELLAIVWALQRLRSFLLPIHFVVITDCQALTHINVSKTTNPQIIRWHSAIAEFDVEIVHRAGERMQHVDALSRSPVEPAETTTEMWKGETAFTISTREEEILLYQSSDAKLKQKIEILKKPVRSRTRFESNEVKGFCLDNGLLCKEVENKGEKSRLFVVLSSMRKALVIRYHDLKNHFGVEKTVNALKRYYYFPEVAKYVKNHIRRCLECILYKTNQGKQPGLLHPIPPGKRPFEIVHIDFLGPFVESKKGNKYILNVVDNFTKFVTSYATKDAKCSSVLKCLKR